MVVDEIIDCTTSVCTPIRLQRRFFNGLHSDEYDTYAPSKLKNIEPAADVEDIMFYLIDIHLGKMGLGASRGSEKEEDSADKLLPWKEGGYRDGPDFRFL